jgi:ArsR family transcriptional regulator
MAELIASPELQSLKAQFFKALARPIRIRILEILVKGEARVQDLQRLLALEQPIVSQQLARLRSTGIVIARKEGTTTYYRFADPELADLLRVAKRILNRRLVGVQSLLRELADEQSWRRRPARSRT